MCKINGSPFVGRIDRDPDWFMIPVRLPQSVYAGDTYDVTVHVPGMRVGGRIIRFQNAFAEHKFPMCKCPVGIGTDYSNGIFSLPSTTRHGNPARQSSGLKMVRQSDWVIRKQDKISRKLSELVSPYGSSTEAMIEIAGGGFCSGNRMSVSLPSKIIATGAEARFKATERRGLVLIALGFPPKNVPAVVRYTLNGEVLKGPVEPGCRWFAQEVKDDHAGIEIVGVSVGGFANPVAGQKFSLGSAGKNQRVLEIPERQVFYPPACIEDGVIHASISGDENLPAASGSLFSHALFDEDVEFASIFDGLGEHAKARKKVKSPKVNLWLVDHNS